MLGCASCSSCARGFDDVAEIALGKTTTCARTGAGEVYCWGSASALTVQIVETNGHICGRRGDGSVTCAALDDVEQKLGRPMVFTLEGLGHIDEIAGENGGSRLCARSKDEVRCFDLAKPNDRTPYNLLASQLVRGIVQIATSDRLYARTDDGRVLRLTETDRIYAGKPWNEEPEVIVAHDAIDLVVRPSRGGCARLKDGSFSCFPKEAHEKIDAAALKDATAVSLIWGAACIRRPDGTGACAGDNDWGQLGDDTRTSASHRTRARS